MDHQSTRPVPIPNSMAYTSSRYITDADCEVIAQFIDCLAPGFTVVTGGCIGGDAFIAAYAHEHGYNVHTVLPADRSRVDPFWREHCTTFEIMPPGSTYRDRNIRLVALGERLTGFPLHPEQHVRSQRSGTWQTVRLARRAKKSTRVRVLRLPGGAV